MSKKMVVLNDNAPLIDSAKPYKQLEQPSVTLPIEPQLRRSIRKCHLLSQYTTNEYVVLNNIEELNLPRRYVT